MTALDLIGLLVLFVPLVLLLEHTHRRTRHLPHAPFGADSESEASWQYRRQLAELRQLERLAASR